MISRFQCEDLPRIFLVSKFEINRSNIKLIITLCAIWHYRDKKKKKTREMITNIRNYACLRMSQLGQDC